MATRATQTTINLETETKMKLKRYIDEGFYDTWDELMIDVLELIRTYESTPD